MTLHSSPPPPPTLPSPPRLHRRYPSFTQPTVYRPPPCRRRATTTPGGSWSSSSSSHSSPTTATPTTSSTSTSPVLPFLDGPPKPSGPLVWINGFPGVGKLTIAQWLHRLLGVDRSLILDHHDNLSVTGRTTLPPTPEVETADPFSMTWCSAPSPCHERNNGEHAPATTPLVADLLSRPETATHTIFVTSCAVKNQTQPSDSRALDDEEGEWGEDGEVDSEDGDEIAAAKAIESTAELTGRLFIPVYISCREDENMRRVTSVERRYSGSGMSLFSARSGKIESEGEARSVRRGRKLFAFEERKGLEVDVTEMEAHEAAVEILGYVHSRVEEWRRDVVAGQC